MAVRVRLTLIGHLRNVVPSPTQSLELPDGATIPDLFQALIAEHGARFAELVMERRRNQQVLRRHVLVVLGGEQIEYEDLATTRLGAAGDEVEVSLFLVQPFAGG